MIAVIGLLANVSAQTTQAWLSGRLTDALSGESISSALIRCVSTDTGREFTFRTGPDGWYVFSGLTPGDYTLLVAAGSGDYQAQEYHRLNLPVAGQVTLDFVLRPLSDVWETRKTESVVLPESEQVLAFYGPDIDLTRRVSVPPDRRLESNLEPSVSTVIHPVDLRELPLNSRDAYSLLVLLPGVTSDSSSGRGLGFSVNGQRPSAANYLLDGLENNNLLVTGPLGAVVPEFIEEYRISTGNFSAEYGRTSGFLANAVTRAGSSVWHGSAFVQIKNDAFNANGFQENRNGIGRAPLKELRPGVTLGGPLLRDRLFVSGALQLRRFRSRNNPQTFALPTAGFISSTDSASPMGRLLRSYPAAVAPADEGDFGLVSIAPPVEQDQALGLARLDWISPDGAHHVFARSSVNRLRQPQLLYNPYPGFSSPFHQGAVSIGAGWVWQITPQFAQELRAGRTGDSNRYDRPHAEIPQLTAFPRVSGNRVRLPSSDSSFAYRNFTSNWELAANWTYLAGRHRWKFGAGLFHRGIDTDLIADRDGDYSFLTADAVRRSAPLQLLIAYDRASPDNYQTAPSSRLYHYLQADFFVQDAVQLTRRFSLSYGLRFDFQGDPVNTGQNKDLVLALGQGATIQERIASAAFAPLPGGGDQRPFHIRGSTWGPRLGISYDLTGSGSTLLRASYGVFYDRLYDNLWQTVSVNRQDTAAWRFTGPVAFLDPPFAVAATGAQISTSQFHQPLVFQPGLRPGIVQSAFVGLQHRISDGVSIEQNLLSSRARHLWTTDLVNRLNSVPGLLGRYNPNPDLEDLYYRGNQGSSDYWAATTTVRFQGERLSGQVAYTWSHTIDNQSDPLVGVFENYNQNGAAQADYPKELPAFARQFDSNADRANANFDQRHNLIAYVVYEVPALASDSRWAMLTRGWRISGLGSLRSGLPYSVFASSFGFLDSGGTIYNQRADRPYADLAGTTSSPVPGGKQLLDPAAFAFPAATSAGNTGRNAFRGPGIISLDLSVARRFALGETATLTLRADFYNALNHANLNNPVAQLGDPNFGQALYGRKEKGNGFPALVPLNETPRQLQLFVQLDF